MERLKPSHVIERGKSLVKFGMAMGWQEVVEKRSDDLYKFNIALDIIEALKNKMSYEKAYEIIEKTCLYDEAEKLIILIVQTFAENGSDFALWVENKNSEFQKSEIETE